MRLPIIVLLAGILLGCGPIDTHIQPVVINADPNSIYAGDTTTLRWSAPGGVQVLSSNFGAQDVNGATDVWPSSSTQYYIKVRLATNDIFTARCDVTVSDPIDDGGGDNGESEAKSIRKSYRAQHRPK